MTTTLTQPNETGAPPKITGDRARWLTLGTLLVAVFMDMLDGNVVSVAIPSIQRSLDAGYSSIQWMTAGYVLAFALLLITGGRLGDIYGRKRIFQIGVAGFATASLLCGLAVSPGMLVGSRLLQGAMAGLMVPQVLSIIHVTFPPSERGKVFAIYGTVGGLAATVAPLIGGVVVQLDLFGLGWRPVFLMNVPVAIAGLAVGWRHIRESKAPVALRLDIIGVVLAGIAVLLLVYPLTQGHDLGWPVWVFVAMVASIAIFAAFAGYERRLERRGGSPLVAPGLFRARSFVSGNALQLVVYIFTGSFFLSWYLFMQIGLGWSALHAGLTALAFCVGAFVTSALSVTVLVQKFGRRVLQVGAVVVAIGLGVFLWVVSTSGGQVTTGQMIVPLLLIGLGFGLIAPPIPVFALADVPHADAGSASGVINTMQQLGLALGIAVVSVVFFTPMDNAALTSVEQLAPQVRQDLVSAGVAPADVDTYIATLPQCTAQRVGASLPADCTPSDAILGNPRAAEVLHRFESDVHGQTFALALKPALVSTMALMGLILLATFGLPRRVPDTHLEEPVAETELSQNAV